jgi:lipopolysaccharide transport system ATP-binding protein
MSSDLQNVETVGPMTPAGDAGRLHDAPVRIMAVDVGKQYRLGAGAEGRLAEAVQNGISRVLRRAQTDREEFWAVRGVSLEARAGEVVGIIGRNGAGKSTMLKLLARITAPTEGHIELTGRVASLLEVGAGFDPELTGRENVYLSGAILGMRRQEIASKFSQIVEFSGVERFIDTPVKRYSSGMFVRLAFSVGAHLESDILLVDEVLAVGDVEFQRKCLAKMQDIATTGRTIVFVSHNTAAVRRLCTRVYLLKGGRVVASGPPAEVIAEHMREAAPDSRDGVAVVPAGAQRGGSAEALLRRATLRDSLGRATDRLSLGEKFAVELDYGVREAIPGAVIEVGIVGPDGHPVATAMNTDGGHPASPMKPGPFTAKVELDVGMLPGDYGLNVILHHDSGGAIDWIESVLRFSVGEVSPDGGESFPWAQVRGSIRPRSDWTFPAPAD